MPTTPPPNAQVDLVDLATLKSWLGLASNNTDDDNTLQLLITGFSQNVLNRCGVASFSTVGNFTELHDGNGRQRLFLRNPPIVSVESVQIGAAIVPQSMSLTQAGYYIDPGGKSIAFRTGGSVLLGLTSNFPYKFTEGQGNIQVYYHGGYAAVPFDLEECALKVIAINYARKDWRDLASKSMSVQGGGMGTTRYRDWEMPPECSRTLDLYSRYARP